MCDKRYQIRSLAGVHWLVDTEQSGNPYHPPFRMNDMGLEIWELFKDGVPTEEIVKMLCKEYEAEEVLIQRDVSTFLEKLKKYLAGEV